MGAIFYREMKAYFSSLLAWSLIAAFLAVVGFFMLLGMMQYAEISASAMQGAMPYNINTYFIPSMSNGIGLFLMFFMPLLTMRIFAEDKRSGMLDLLFTYPLSDWAIVLGKFWATMVVVALMLAFSSLSYIFLSVYCTVEWPIVLSGYLSLLLMGASMAAIGLFTSSLSSSQLVASALNYGALLLMWLLYIPDSRDAVYTALFGKLSIMSHTESLLKGVLNAQDIIYYLAVTIFFLYLTVCFIESRKWRG